MKVEISVGEAIDKLSILEIKKEKIKNQQKKENVIKEQLILSESLKNIIKGELETLFKDLYEINSRLWDIEDKIREKELSKEFDSDFIELARSIYQTNDLRFELKQKINKICNSDIIEEKEHINYRKN